MLFIILSFYLFFSLFISLCICHIFSLSLIPPTPLSVSLHLFKLHDISLAVFSVISSSFLHPIFKSHDVNEKILFFKKILIECSLYMYLVSSRRKLTRRHYNVIIVNIIIWVMWSQSSQLTKSQITVNKDMNTLWLKD